MRTALGKSISQATLARSAKTRHQARPTAHVNGTAQWMFTLLGKPTKGLQRLLKTKPDRWRCYWQANAENTIHSWFRLSARNQGLWIEMYATNRSDLTCRSRLSRRRDARTTITSTTSGITKNDHTMLPPRISSTVTLTITSITQTYRSTPPQTITSTITSGSPENVRYYLWSEA